MGKIRDAPQPSTKKEVRSFLGLVGYYRRFVPQFAEIAQPLTDLTRGKTAGKVKWNEDCKKAFAELKRCFCEPPICRLPVRGKPFILRTDASDAGVGAMLFQQYDGELLPVACASKKLSRAEKNYPVIEKECLALVWGIQKFEVYLYGSEFTVQMDHSPLQYIERVKSVSGRITRWALQLQPFKFVVKAIPGRENVGADYLSRLDGGFQ